MNHKALSFPQATVGVVVLGTFISSFDINVVNMALPVMQSVFQTTIHSIEWVIVAYLLALSATQLIFGRLSDLFSRKKIYLTGMTVFTFSSLACALSPSLPVLILARVAQALGAAMMSSSASPIIIDTVDPQQRGKSLGFLAMAVAVATCLGPSLGGLLVSRFGWNSIFLVNVPIGLIGAFLALRFIPERPVAAQSKGFDALGSVLMVVALSLIMLSLSQMSSVDGQSALTPLMLIAGLLLLVIFALHEQRAASPLLNPALFKIRIFTGSTLAAMFFYMAEFILVFLAPYYYQRFHGFTPLSAGLLMFPMSLAMIIGAPISGAIADRFDSKLLSCAGLGMMALGILWFSTFSASTPIPALVCAMFLLGLGGGFFQTPNTNAVMSSVRTDQRGVASATLGTMRNVGMATGEAISAALIASTMNRQAARLTAQGLSGAALWAAEFSPALRITVLAAALCALVALALSYVRGSLKPVGTAAPSANPGD